MYNDLRNAVALLKDYCNSHYCRDCPLNHVVCYGISAPTPCGYSLDIFDRNVKEIEKEKMRTAVKELESEEKE